MRTIKKQELTSCYQCAGIAHCYGSKNPPLDRLEARVKANLCNSLHKGFPINTVKISGYDKGMSRKNAESLVQQGLAVWVDKNLIIQIGPFPENIANRLNRKKA